MNNLAITGLEGITFNQVETFVFTDYPNFDTAILPTQILSSFPLTVDIAAQLVTFDLSSSSRSTLWPFTSEVHVMEKLIIEGSAFTSIPTNPTNFPVLEELDIADNLIASGTTIGNYPELVSIYINGNALTSLVLTLVPKVKFVHCYDCSLTEASQIALIQELVDGGLTNGELLTAGNNASINDGVALTNLITLEENRGWTVQFNTDILGFETEDGLDILITEQESILLREDSP